LVNRFVRSAVVVGLDDDWRGFGLTTTDTELTSVK